MASTRFVSRLLAPTTLTRLSTIGSKSGGSVRYFCGRHHHKNLPETSFDSASNVFQRWEKEFDRMQQSFGNYFRDLKNNRSLVNPASGENDKFFFHTDKDLIVTEPDGSRKFYFSLNIRNFEPEEIKIKTENGTLTISAKKEKKGNNNYSLHEFSQTYTLPEELKIDDLKSSYTENGILSIEAPLPKVERKDRQIQIERAK